MYSAVDLSKYIVNKCTRDKHPITNLQLQKILYYIQKAFLNKNDKAFDDAIEAWQFGPVVPKSYYNFCGFGAMPITVTYDKVIDLDLNDKKLIDSIIVSKRSLPPWDLVEETHKPNGAWAKAYNNGSGNHTVISTESIRKCG